jgi:hypothetical protein
MVKALATIGLVFIAGCSTQPATPYYSQQAAYYPATQPMAGPMPFQGLDPAMFMQRGKFQTPEQPRRTTCQPSWGQSIECTTW